MLRGPRFVALAASRHAHHAHHHSYASQSPLPPPQEEIVPRPVYVTRVEITDVERIGEVEFYLIRVYAEENMSMIRPLSEGKGGTYAQVPEQQQSWTVSHRYGAWKNLRDQLETQGYLKTISNFPTSSWSFSSLFSKRTPLTDEEVETRKRELAVWLNEVIGIVRSEEGPRGATRKEHEAAKKLVDQFLAVENHFRREAPALQMQRAEPIPLHSSAYEAVAATSSAPTVLPSSQANIVQPSQQRDDVIYVAPVAVIEGTAVT